MLEVWVLNDVSFKQRIDFIVSLENLLFYIFFFLIKNLLNFVKRGEGEEINKRVENEIDFQQNHHKISFTLIEKLKERSILRNKLNVEDFSYSANKKLYSFLRNLAENIENLLDEYEESQDQAFAWKGINVREVKI